MSEMLDMDVPYALEQRVVTRARIPVLGWREIVTRSYATVRFAADPAGGWRQTFTQCAIETDGGQVTFPPAFILSIAPKVSSYTLVDGTYQSDTGEAFIGVHRAVAKLPEEPLDPLVADADGDGHPGVTVDLKLPILGTIHLYMAQANHSVLTGTLADGEISGMAEMRRLETRTLSASSSIFAANPPVEVVEGASTFRIVPDPTGLCRERFHPPVPPT